MRLTDPQKEALRVIASIFPHVFVLRHVLSPDVKPVSLKRLVELGLVERFPPMVFAGGADFHVVRATRAGWNLNAFYEEGREAMRAHNDENDVGAERFALDLADLLVDADRCELALALRKELRAVTAAVAALRRRGR